MATAARGAGTVMVRVPAATHASLAALAAEEGMTMGEVLVMAVERYQRERFIAAANAEMEAMRRDQPEAWDAYQAEARAWDATLKDGLEADE
jgi:hypothetical protein